MSFVYDLVKMLVSEAKNQEITNNGRPTAIGIGNCYAALLYGECSLAFENNKPLSQEVKERIYTAMKLYHLLIKNKDKEAHKKLEEMYFTDMVYIIKDLEPKLSKYVELQEDEHIDYKKVPGMISVVKRNKHYFFRPQHAIKEEGDDFFEFCKKYLPDDTCDFTALKKESAEESKRLTEELKLRIEGEDLGSKSKTEAKKYKQQDKTKEGEINSKVKLIYELWKSKKFTTWQAIYQAAGCTAPTGIKRLREASILFNDEELKQKMRIK